MQFHFRDMHIGIWTLVKSNYNVSQIKQRNESVDLYDNQNPECLCKILRDACTKMVSYTPYT